MKRIAYPLFALAFLLQGPLLAAHPQSQPNVVVIISDDQGFHDFGFMKHPVVQTPNLDKLASESLLFRRGYVTTALCSPSLASMLTGAYPHQHGWTGNDPAKEIGGWGKRQPWIDKFASFPQLPAILAKNGYLSLHTGKYWQGDPQKVSGFTDTMGKTLRHGSPESLGVGRDGMQSIYDFIKKSEDQKKPFMVWYAPFLPHTPHTPPDRLFEKYKDKAPSPEIAKYFAMVEWLDESVGDLMSYLDKEGLAENTIVLFIVDNGWGQGARGFRGHKLTPWEQGVRTPIMVRWPGKVAPREENMRLASNLDIPVTILTAAGISIPDTMEGINLMDDQAVDSRKAIYLEDFDHDMIAPDKPEATLEARSVIDGFWKLVISYANAEGGGKKVDQTLLFDLGNDPKEADDLAAKHPDVVERLLKKIDSWWDPEIGDEANNG